MANSTLNLGNLVSYRNEILKAEIGALLFNLGKTHIGFWAKKNGKTYFNLDKTVFEKKFGYKPFNGYRKYYQKDASINIPPFEYDLNRVNIRLKNFIFNNFVEFPFNIENNKKKIKWDSFFKGDALENNEEGKVFVQKIFFRGCENINSGIDKGSPQDSNKLDTLWISNAFGTFKRPVEEQYFDDERICFFRSLHKFLEDNNYYSNPDWEKIREFVFNKIKSWYSRLLSDSRFPVNDVTLFDQAYMTASMFKATLAGMFLDNSRYQNYLNNPQSIKWSILGIQYDKLGLAEKGLKASYINWYREASQKVDKKVKNIIELKYALGNEVYRDETGIYFIVPENIIGEEDSDFHKLHSGLNKINEEIQNIFTSEFGGEVYPALFLTKPSRGLMNLGHLVSKASENFLKSEYPKDFEKNLKHDKESKQDNDESKSIRKGICQVCGVRLAVADKEKQDLVCDVCKERSKGRLKDWWFNSGDKETIWLDELQDKNGRVALVTVKFELGKWLNGDLMNSLVLNNVNFFLFLSKMKDTVDAIKFLYNKNAFSENSYKTNSNTLNEFLIDLEKNIGFLSSFNRKFKKSTLTVDTKNNRVILRDSNGNPQNNKVLLNNIAFKKFIRLFDFEVFNTLSHDAYNGCKSNDETFDNFIRQIFFGSILGNEWEDLVKSSALNSKIDWASGKERILWDKLTNSDIEFLSEILLQFLLRKNPSPARLRRVWETTKEFLEDLESRLTSDLLKSIPKERKKRVVITLANSAEPDGKYEWNGINFWKKGNQIKLISSIEVFASAIGKELKNIDEGNIKNFISKAKIVLKSKEGSKVTPIDLSIQSNFDAKLENYKPYFTILSPTPVSWQFIIPAQYTPELIENVQKEYCKNFKWVYGKLPLHIGVIVQNYKSPLYIGIKALRKIRRDGIKWNKLSREIDAEKFKARQKEAFHYQTPPEKTALCEDFYSLFERKNGTGKYKVYLYPDEKPPKKVWIDTTQSVSPGDKFIVYPNTFDFEFLDTNARRNDIYYDGENKRYIDIKIMRPYDIEDWKYFENFKKYFSRDDKSSSQLQKLTSLIYSKLEDWKDDAESVKKFMISAFRNVLNIKDSNSENEFAKVLGAKNFDEFQNMQPEEFVKKLYMFLDMFEFWHKSLKEA